MSGRPPRSPSSRPVPLAADVTIHYKLTEDGQPKGTSAQYVSSEKLRMEQPDQDMIVEFATGKMTFIDKKKNEYWEVTRAELVSALETSQKKMDESMAKVPPAMREKMAAMMGGGGAARPSRPAPAAGRSRATTRIPTRSRWAR